MANVVCNGVSDAIMNHTTRLQLDPTHHKSKPEKNSPEEGAIVNHLKRKAAVQEISVRELAELIGDGGTFMPSICTKKSKASWQSCAGFCIDIDNDNAQHERGYLPLNSVQAIKRAAEYDLHPAIVYETFSSSKEREKYRMLFLFADEVTDRELFERMAAKMLDLYPDADQQTVEHNRHFYGTDKRVLIMPSAQILPAEEFAARLDAVERMPPNDPSHKPEDKDGSGTGTTKVPWEEATEGETSRAKSMLAKIPPQKLSYEAWCKVGMALHAGGHPYEVWDGWNRQDAKRYDEADNRKKWESFGNYTGGRPITMAYLVELAYRFGWKPQDPPAAECFVINEQGKLLRTYADEEKDPKPVTSTPPYIVADLVDIDTGEYRVLVGMDVPTQYGKKEQVTTALDPADLFNKNKIIETLTRLHGNISSTNAADVVAYLTACGRAKWRPNVPRYKSVSRLGWAGAPLGAFMPYDDAKADKAQQGSIYLETGKNAAMLSPFIASKGTLQEWVEGIKPLREQSVPLRAMLAASFASPLVAVLNVQPFIVYDWAMSGSGKTPSAKAAASVWGDPTNCANSYVMTFNDKPLAIQGHAVFYHDLPVVIDEFQSMDSKGGNESKKTDVANLLYNLSLGHERARSNTDGSQRSYSSWNCLTIATGEIPISSHSAMQGVLNRTLEMNAEPFRDRRTAGALHSFVAEQYGVAGSKYIKCLKGNTIEDFYKPEWQSIRDAVNRIAWDNPQADNIAFLALADALAEFYIFNPGMSWDAAREGALLFATRLESITQKAVERDTDRMAMAFINNWLYINRAHFVGNNDEALAFEKYGVIEEEAGETCFYVLNTVFRRAVATEAFDEQKTLRKMAEVGIIKRGKNRYTVQKRMGGDTGRQQCVCIVAERLDAFLTPDDPDGQSAAAPSTPQEG